MIEEIEYKINTDKKENLEINKFDEKKKNLHDDPKIFTIDNFLSSKDCDHMIKTFKNQLQDALVSGDKAGQISQGRTAKNCWVEHNFDKTVSKISKKISDLVGIPLNQAEKLQIIYYDKNGEYRQHYDGWLFDGSERARRNMKLGGQRLKTALVYLNTVEKGGGTKFTKLDLEVSAEKGKLLVFDNVYEDSLIRHELSEHAGMPVIEGEKWAFNFWFRHLDINEAFEYPEPKESEMKREVALKTGVEDIDIDIQKVPIDKSFMTYKDLFELSTYSNFLDMKEMKEVWIDSKDMPDLYNKFSQVLRLDPGYLEKLRIVKYKKGENHENHLDAFDVKSDKGKELAKDKGQRLITITGFLSPTKLTFPKINKEFDMNPGDVIIYQNCYSDTNIRIEERIKNYKELDNNKIGIFLFTIYVREKCNTNPQILKIKNFRQTNEQSVHFEDENVNYIEVLNKFYNNPVNELLSLKGFKIANVVPDELVQTTINVLKQIKMKESFLNPENLFNMQRVREDNPCICENVLTPNIHNIFKRYIHHNIESKFYPLGDRQAQRYKTNDEILCRLLHLECLPLINKLVGREMIPTYTYLSCYTKGTKLDPHTDREACEFTVSYIISKPPGSNWNIYWHKETQNEKHGGRSEIKPSKEDCIACDCNENGLMMFSGTDHLHFREELEHDYYNIVLLHYCTKKK